MSNKIAGRLFLVIGALLLGTLFAWEAWSEEITIVEVRRNIPLADDGPVYRDYYLNAGTDNGVKKNLVVTAFRNVTMKDSTGAHSYGEMMVPVGQLKVIFANEKTAVAREYKLLSRDEQPMLEQESVMNGDKIDLKGSFIDNRPLPVKKKAKLEQKQESVAVAVVIQPTQAPTLNATTATMPNGAPPAVGPTTKPAVTPTSAPATEPTAKAATPASVAPATLLKQATANPGDTTKQ